MKAEFYKISFSKWWSIVFRGHSLNLWGAQWCISTTQESGIGSDMVGPMRMWWVNTFVCELKYNESLFVVAIAICFCGNKFMFKVKAREMMYGYKLKLCEGLNFQVT